MTSNTKQHWETVYETKTPEQVSWTQKIPETSLNFINSFQLSKEAKIMDIGGGDSDVLDFIPDTSYDMWHDRAAFHFLTTKNQIDTYISLTQKFVSRNLIIGAFSDNGPLKCSGLEITQYSKNKMSEAFNAGFEPIKCIRETHQTPFKTTQDFVFCSFKKQ